jgi:hypothetical protein
VPPGWREHGDGEREKHAAEDQVQCGRDALQDQRQDRDLERNGLAHLGDRQILQIVDVLRPQRLIETVQRADARDRLRRSLGAQQRPYRIAGDQLHHEEGQHADPEQDGDQLEWSIGHEAIAMHDRTPVRRRA